MEPIHSNTPVCNFIIPDLKDDKFAFPINEHGQRDEHGQYCSGCYMDTQQLVPISLHPGTREEVARRNDENRRATAVHLGV